MRLRNKLILVGLVTLVLPWAGWQYLRETEQFLRKGEERALLATAGVLARAAARQYQREPWSRGLYVRRPAVAPLVDGYVEQDWEPWGTQALALGPVRLGLAEAADTLYLALVVPDDQVRYVRPGAAAVDGDHLLLTLAGAHGDRRYLIATEAPGWVQARPLGDTDSIPVRGEWQSDGAGYSVELRIPAGSTITGLGLAVVDVDGAEGVSGVYGTGEGDQSSRPRPLVRPLTAADIAELAPAGGRMWLIDREGWVLARGGELAPEAGIPEGRWLRSVLYRYLLASSLDAPHDRPEDTLRLAGGEVDDALARRPAARWQPAASESTVVASAAAPVLVLGEVVGAVVVEQGSDSLLLLTNRALTRLLTTTALAFAAALAVLFVFASRLSLRIRRLRDAAERAVSSDGLVADSLPLAADRDELGDLSRAFGQAMRDLRDYTAYLKTLADKLSHELRTPLAVVSSSLDNLVQESLPAAAAPYVDRARQGTLRLGKILRSMSEASRLEQSLSREEGEVFDLAALAKASLEAYQGMAPDRRFNARIATGDFRFFGSPELLGQLLDKLIDNALGYTPVNGWIRLELERLGAEVELRVANQGPLLPERMRGRLFDSMVSVREGSDDQPHLGLGLYIVRLITELHAGEVRAANLEDGSGVVFSVRMRGMAVP